MFIRSLFFAVVKRRIWLLPLRAGRVALLAVLSLLAFAPAADAASADFTSSPPAPEFNQPVSFDASASGFTGTITYLWDFGDGQTGSGQTVSHPYGHNGGYPVTLTVVDSTGAYAQRTHQIGVGPPTAAFNPTAATVLAGSPVSFDGTQSSDPFGTIAGYSWNFGDGATSTAAQPSHAYATPGTYNATLTVTDNPGYSASVTHQITVTAPAPIQTLVESVIPAPILIKFAPPSIARPQLVDLGERLFCPGEGPTCETAISETSTGLARNPRARKGAARARAASGTFFTTPANGNAELALHLSSRQWSALRKTRHLRVVLSIVSTRGGEKTTSTLRLKLSYPAKKKG